MASRKHTFQFRVDDDEREHLRAAAADAGFDSASAFVREAVLARTAVVIGGTDITIVRARSSSEADDKRVELAVQNALRDLNGQVPPLAAGNEDAVTPPEPAPAPATSPGEGERMVGSPASHEPPVSVPPEQPEPGQEAAGGNSGPGEILAGSATSLEPGGAGACPGCGGINGRHQAFCEQLTGEPPVTGTAASTSPEPEGRPIESREQFLERRVGEGELLPVAEAEWRQLTSPQAAGASTGPIACSQCGTTKLSAALPCPDCGATT